MNRLFYLLHVPNRWFDSLSELYRVEGSVVVLTVLLVIGMFSAKADIAIMGSIGIIALYRWHYLYLSQS